MSSVSENTETHIRVPDIVAYERIRLSPLQKEFATSPSSRMMR